MKAAVVAWRGLIAMVLMTVLAQVPHARGQCGPAWIHLWPPTDAGGVDSMVEHDGRLYVAGNFEWIGDQNIPYLAVWDGVEWSAPAHTPPGPVREVLEWRGGLVLRGEFTKDGGYWYSELVSVTEDGFEALTGASDVVEKIGLFKDELVVMIQNGEVLEVRRFDGASWSSMGSITTGSLWLPWVTLQEYGEKLYCGLGAWEMAPSMALLRYKGDAWEPVASAETMEPLRGVMAMTVIDDELLIAGDFDSVNGTPADSIAAWNGEEWHAFGAGLSDQGWDWGPCVSSMAVFEGELYAAGAFWLSDGVELMSVARWDGGRWVNAGSYSLPYLNLSLATFGSEMLFGVTNGRSGDDGAPRFGRYTPTNIPWIARQPEDVESAAGATLVLRCRSAADYAAEYRWSRQGIPLSDGATGHGSVISGSATHELVVSNLSSRDAGGYTCEVWNECGGETSRVAMVTLCRADLNADGFVNGNDYDLFADAFDAADPAADFNSDGFVNADDYDAFAEAFEGGC
ncbi:MAG: immunoglobulin domain-containing protein [Phycisphaerae bacterium]|nr:immunoglobulin domain-containing protein [Phycisphaerae bacterium]